MDLEGDSGPPDHPPAPVRRLPSRRRDIGQRVPARRHMEILQGLAVVRAELVEDEEVCVGR